MWNDNDTNIDLIDFDHLAFGITNILRNEALLPCTVGIFGDWGSGKSSLLRMVEDKIKTEDGILIVRFNGWLFEGYDDAKTALASTIIEQTIGKRTLTEQAKKVASKLLKQIDLLKVAKYAAAHGIAFMTTGGIGNVLVEAHRLTTKSSEEKSNQDFDYETLVTKLSSSDDQETAQLGAKDFHANFSLLLKETAVKKLVVLIDDLDRCNADTIISILEAIKLFLFAKGSAFIIAADERLIKYAVRKRFPELPGDNAEVGRDYLEKLIQFPVRIPQLSEHEMEAYVNLLFTRLHITNEANFEDVRMKVIATRTKSLFSSVYNSENIDAILGAIPKPPELANDLLMSAQITPILAKGLNGNPRQGKRFLNTLLMRNAMAHSKGIQLSKRVMAKLMLLEYFRPETFKLVSDWQSQQNGKPDQLAKAEDILKTPGAIMNTNDNELLKECEKDSWLKSWIINEPTLKETDLQPYYFFSRDSLKPFSVDRSRISSEGQEVLAKIMSSARAVQEKGFESLANLSAADGAAIFSTLTSKARQEEDSAKRSDLLKLICKVSEVRKDMIGELLIFLASMPVKSLTAGIVPVVKQTFKAIGDPNGASRIIESWSQNKENSRLATAAKA